MSCRLYRPLNAPVLSLMTELGERLFLLDTGCPVSFAQEARELMAGAWFEEPTPLRAAPFSLAPLRERLGLPIEGFIGLGALTPHGDALLHFDQGTLSLGEEAREAARGLVESGVRPLVAPLTTEHKAPISLSLRLDGEERSCYLDTGSRFIVTKASQPLKREPQAPLYSLALVTPVGSLTVEVSATHRVELEGESVTALCVATGAPPQHPNILGMEWLTHFNVLLSFQDRRVALFPRSSQPQVWERLRESSYLPPIELSFAALDYTETDRPFHVLPRLGEPLPNGLSPFTPYRLKGHTTPSGVEGVNALMSAMISEGPALHTLVGPQGEEVALESTPLFKVPQEG